MAYNPNINQNIRFEIKPMLYKKAIIKKEGFWITNFPEGSTDYKKFEAWKCVYFPLSKTDEEFCKEWRTIADKTFYKLSKLKNQALGIAVDDEVNEESNTEVNDNEVNDNEVNDNEVNEDNDEQSNDDTNEDINNEEPTKTEQTE